jgi:hypothetical protein
MAIELKFFDAHTGEYLLDIKDEPFVESLTHTALEFNYPNGRFSVAVMDERTTVEELQNNHPEGHRLLVSNGSRFIYADPETYAQIDRIFPEVPGEGVRGIKDRGAYGSLLLGACSGKHEQLRLKMVPEDGNEWEVDRARQTWKNFQETGKLVVDIDPAVYGAASPQTIPQLLLPTEAYPKFATDRLYSVTPEFLATKFDIPARKIELAPQVFERKLKILIIDDENGANSTTIDADGKKVYGFDNLDKDAARALTGDCHGRMSEELARAKFNTDNRIAIQFRGEMKGFGSQLEQKSEAYTGFAADKICKGSLVAHDFDKLAFQGERPDIILAKSSFKGAEKPSPGLYEQPLWLAEKDRSRMGKTSVSGLIALYPGMLKDIAPTLEAEVANLAAIQNDPVALATSYCADFERRNKKQLDTDDVGYSLDPETAGEGAAVSTLPREKYDLMKASLDSGNEAMLRSGAIAGELQDFVRTKFRDLALGKHDDINFDRGFAIPSKGLKDGEIYIPGYPDGEEFIVFRAPVISTNGIHKLVNKKPEGCGDEDLQYVLCNDSTAASLGRTRQTVMEDFGLDFDGDCLGYVQASKFPNLLKDVEAAQLDRFPDNIKEPKLEFDGCSQEEAAMRMQNAIPVGIIANANMRLQSHLSTIAMMSDSNGIATDFDRLQYATQISDRLGKYDRRCEKNEEPLLQRPANLEGSAKEWFDRLEVATDVRMDIILNAPRLDLISPEFQPNADQTVSFARSITESLAGHRRNFERDWFKSPTDVDPDTAKSFADLTDRAKLMNGKIDEILAVNAIGSKKFEDSAKVLNIYKELQNQGSDLILQATRSMYRDFVVVGSYQTQVAADMPKSARGAEPEVVGRLNQFLPSKIAMMSDKKSELVYKNREMKIDGKTPQEAVANRINDYFSKTQIEVESIEGYRSLFSATYTPQIQNDVLNIKKEFDSLWGEAAQQVTKARNENGCVLKITDDLDRSFEITNLSKFGHGLAYNPELLNNSSFRIIKNDPDNEQFRGISTYHRYAIVAEGKFSSDSGERYELILGTLCENSARTLGIINKDISNELLATTQSDADRKFTSVKLAPAAPDLSSQLFQEAKDIAAKFRNDIVSKGEDLTPYAAAMWHESTRVKSANVKDDDLSGRENRISSATYHFFPEQLKEQIKTHPLNLHQITLLEGLTPADLPAPGESFQFQMTKEPILTPDGKEIGSQRIVNLIDETGDSYPIAKPWANSIPFDLSGRVSPGQMTQGGMSTMFLELPGVDKPLEIGKVNAHYLADREWTDRAAHVAIKPVIKADYVLYHKGQNLGKVDQRALALMEGSDYLQSGHELTATVKMSTYAGKTYTQVNFPEREGCARISCELSDGKAIAPELVGLKMGVEEDLTLRVEVKKSFTLGVFMKEADGEHQIAELTTHATSKATIKELARIGAIEWHGLSVETDNKGKTMVGGTENRTIAPVVINGDFPGAYLRGSGKNLAILTEPVIKPQRLPVVQQQFGTDFIDRLYADATPKLTFDATFGRVPLAAKLATQQAVSGDDELAALFGDKPTAKTRSADDELAALFGDKPTAKTRSADDELAALFGDKPTAKTRSADDELKPSTTVVDSQVTDRSVAKSKGGR